MAAEGQVVVFVRPVVLHKEAAGVFAAQIPELGLGAYSATPTEALDKLEKMFVGAVQARRHLGKLAEWLNHSGVEWYWLDDYTKHAPALDVARKLRLMPGGWRALGTDEPDKLIA